MNNEIMKFDVESLITDITYQTLNIYNGNISEEQISKFREYLEDIILFEIISCKDSRIECSSVGREVTDNIKIALIASGISPKGKIPEGTAYIPRTISVGRNEHYYAKSRVIELDNERENGRYVDRMYSSINNFRANQRLFPNMRELAEMGIAQNERNCGYIEDNNQAVDFFEGCVQSIWMTKKAILQNFGFQNNIAYEICDEMYTRPYAKHYPLATKEALTNMAEIAMFVAQYGKVNFHDYDKLEETLRNIEAAKLTDPELISKYEKRFKSIMVPELEESNDKETKKGLFLLPKKTKR